MKFSWVVRNIKGCLNFLTFTFCFWLNLLIDDCHFSYIAKLREKEKEAH
jgi:hypothetical protein